MRIDAQAILQALSYKNPLNREKTGITLKNSYRVQNIGASIYRRTAVCADFVQKNYSSTWIFTILTTSPQRAFSDLTKLAKLLGSSLKGV